MRSVYVAMRPNARSAHTVCTQGLKIRSQSWHLGADGRGAGPGFTARRRIWRLSTRSCREIPNQILFSFSSDKDRRTDNRIRRKNTAQPRRESNPGSCEFQSHALTTELRSHNGNCVWILDFHQAVSSFYTTSWPGLPESTTRSDQRKLAGFRSIQSSTRSCREIPNQILFSFSSDKDRRE